MKAGGRAREGGREALYGWLEECGQEVRQCNACGPGSKGLTAREVSAHDMRDVRDMSHVRERQSTICKATERPCQWSSGLAT